MSAKDTENLNKDYAKLFDPLPAALGGSTESGSVQEVVEFLKKNVPPSDQKEIHDEFGKNVPLGKQPKKKFKQNVPAKKNKYLTAREKRDLGLYKLNPKDGQLQFKKFKKLHLLWKEYMKEIIDFSKLPEKNADQESFSGGRIPGVILDETLQLKICRADMHGCYMKVTRALNSCLIGLQGIVVMETRNTFRIVNKKNEVKEVPKNGTSFTFAIEGLVVTLSGSSFIMKPSERAVKKWKRKPPFEF